MMSSRKLTAGFILLLVSGLGLVVTANLWKASLLVKKIVVTGNRIVATNEILQLAHLKPGQRLFDLDLMVIQRDVASHDFLKDAVVERDLPSTIRISVTERTPVAMLTSAEMPYLDEDGVVLPHSISEELSDLPLIGNVGGGEMKLEPGMRLPQEDVRQALDIILTAKLMNKELYHLISEVKLRGGGDIIFFTTEGGIPVIFGKGEVANKLVRFETFWNEIVRVRGYQSVNYIDLRYDDQVVVRWANNNRKTSQAL